MSRLPAGVPSRSEGGVRGGLSRRKVAAGFIPGVYLTEAIQYRTLDRKLWA